jgi:hypothetical protein
MTKRLSVAIVLGILVTPGVFSAVPSSDPTSAEPPATQPLREPTASDSFNSLQNELHQARTQGNWSHYLIVAKRQAEFLNGSPLSRLEVARAEAHLGDLSQASSELLAFVNMAQSSELLDTLPDLAPLRATPSFAAIEHQNATNREPVARSILAFRLKDRHLLPEDIDFDRNGRRFFISSVLERKVVTAMLNGELADFAIPPDNWPIFALKIDPARQVLWVSEAAIEGFEGIDPSVQGRSALLCYDLSSGKLLQRIEGPRPSALGDMTLSVDGAVIVSDGEHGGIYRAHRGDDHMERIDAGEFISPQTPAIAADGLHLFVPDYVRGLALMTLKTKQVVWLPTQGRFALNGIDGLYRIKDRLIAVQNGTSPERVVTFTMDPRQTSMVAEDLIERSTNTLGDPTHGVVVDNTFYYIANSGWNVLDDHGKVKPGMALSEPLVMKVDLDTRPRRSSGSR